MKTTLAMMTVVLALLVGSASADEGNVPADVLASLGLPKARVMKDTQSQHVRGKFAFVIVFSKGSIVDADFRNRNAFAANVSSSGFAFGYAR